MSRKHRKKGTTAPAPIAYGGSVHRSYQAARWAALFDELGIAWVSTSGISPDGRGPFDLIVPRADSLVCVKTKPDEDCSEASRLFSLAAEYDLSSYARVLFLDAEADRRWVAQKDDTSQTVTLSSAMRVGQSAEHDGRFGSVYLIDLPAAGSGFFCSYQDGFRMPTQDEKRPVLIDAIVDGRIAKGLYEGGHLLRAAWPRMAEKLKGRLLDDA